MIAAVVAFGPGGGTAAGVIIQAISLAFLAAIAWVASSCTASTGWPSTRWANADGPPCTRPPPCWRSPSPPPIACGASSLGEVAWLILVGGREVYAVLRGSSSLLGPRAARVTASQRRRLISPARAATGIPLSTAFPETASIELLVGEHVAVDAGVRGGDRACGVPGRRGPSRGGG